MHDWPGIPMNVIRTIDDPILAGYKGIEIDIIGKGGYSTLSQDYIDPLYAASKDYWALDEKARKYYKERKFLFKLCVINASTASNVVAE